MLRPSHETQSLAAPQKGISEQKRICFVIDDLFRQSSLMAAEELVNAGHQVSLLFKSQLDLRKWQSHGKKSISCIPLSPQGPQISSLLPAVHSYHIFQWMLQRASEFDTIHFPLTQGLAYYTFLAKHQGWAFQKMTFCLDIHAPTLWHKHTNQQWIDQVDDLAVDFLERESVRLADILVSQNASLLDWMKKQGWQLPNALYSFSHMAKAGDKIKAEWLSLHENVRSKQPLPSFSVHEKQKYPLVSLCLTHFNRPHYLKQALESIRQQDYPHFEVILVDDASTLPEAQAYLDSLTEEFESKGWQIIRNKKNLFPGAARNLAARQSRGEYLLFMDDDNYAKPQEISTFVQVALKTGADILTCAMDVFEGQSVPTKETTLLHRFLPLGAAVGIGVYFNLFGDINALIKKKVYEALNGLTEDHGVGGEDWELFARAVLKGYHLETIPLALFWYRDTPRSITKTTHLYANALRGIRSYLDAIPLALHGNLLLSQAQQDKLNKLLMDHHHLGKMLQRCWQLFSSRAWSAMRHPHQSLRKMINRLFK